MTHEIAQAVLRAVPEGRGALKGPEAERVVRAWLVARGFEVDRWGNYMEPDPGTGKAPLRWKFKKLVVDKQTRVGPGDWRNLKSISLVSAGTSLAKEAAKTLGLGDVERRFEAAQERKAAQGEKRVAAVKEKRAHENAEGIAWKYLEAYHPEETYAFLTESATEDQKQFLLNTLARYTREVASDLAAGKPFDDGQLVSADRPPALPVFSEASYRWTEDVSGVAYTIQVTHRGRRQAIVQIGKTGGWVGVDPVSRAPRMEIPDASLKGDASIHGTLEWSDGKLYARLFMILAHEKQKGAGGRVLGLWCALMRGYGIEMWLAEAVGDEGAAFFEQLARRGDLEIVGRKGANWAIRCTMRGDQPSLHLVPNTGKFKDDPASP